VQELKVEAIITAARQHILHNLLQTEAYYVEKIYDLPDEKIR
jgi:hypothetical protein